MSLGIPRRNGQATAFIGLPPEVFYTHCFLPHRLCFGRLTQELHRNLWGANGLKIWQRFAFASQQQEASLDRSAQ